MPVIGIGAWFATTVVGLAAGSASAAAVAAMAYANPESDADCPEPTAGELVAQAVEERSGRPYDLRWDVPKAVGVMNDPEGRTLEYRLYDDPERLIDKTDAASRALFGPFLCVGHCLAPLFPPGAYVLADPTVPAAAGSLVAVYRPKAPPTARVSIKVLQFLLGKWWFVTLDGYPPLPIHRTDILLGTVVASVHLPADHPQVIEAERMTAELEAVHPEVPPAFIAAGQAAAAALAAKAPDAEPIPYPWPNATDYTERWAMPMPPFAGPLSAEQRFMFEDAGIPIMAADALGLSS